MPKKPTKVYHVTSEDRVPRILREGLKPQSERSSQRGVVWFWERYEDALGWRDSHPGKRAILEVDMGKDILQGRIIARGARYATGLIDPRRIRRRL